MHVFSVSDSTIELADEFDPDLMGVHGPAYSPEGDRLALLSSYGVVCLYDSSTLQEIGVIELPLRGAGGTLTFSSNGNNLLVEQAGHTLRIFSAHPEEN